MSETTERNLSRLPGAAGRLAAVFARPRVLAAFCVIALAALGWLALGLSIGGVGGFAALCRPVVAATWDGRDFAVVFLMWGAMTLAMMLPSAAPMILTYAEIADTAAHKGERIVSPFTLTAGYSLVWLGFAAVATLAQFVFTRAAFIDSGMASASGLFSGAIFIAAGVYQFSALKHACLTQCQHPFPFFFAHWATTPRGVLRLGLKQGLYCLGCCWAMMLVMFALGVMNVIWMAALGAVMTLEKLGTGRRFTYALGAVLIAAGLGFVLTALVTHWPAHSV